MESNKARIKPINQVKGQNKYKLAKWGMTGAIVLFTYSIITYIIALIVDFDMLWTIFSVFGLILGCSYLVLGVVVIMALVKNRDNRWWWLLLIGGIFAIIAPLSWFGIGGLIIALFAALSFNHYMLMSRKSYDQHFEAAA